MFQIDTSGTSYAIKLPSTDSLIYNETITNVKYRNNKLYFGTNASSIIEIDEASKVLQRWLRLPFGVNFQHASKYNIWDVDSNNRVIYGGVQGYFVANSHDGTLCRFDGSGGMSNHGLYWVICHSPTVARLYGRAYYSSNSSYYYGYYEYNPTTNVLTNNSCGPGYSSNPPDHRQVKKIGSNYYFLGGWSGTAQHIAVASKSTDGITMSSGVKSSGDNNSYDCWFSDVAEDSNGDWYLCGVERQGASTYYAGLVMKVNSAGTIAWTKRYKNSSNNNLHVQFFGIAVDSSGVYIHGNGSTGIDTMLMQVSKTDGTITWHKSLTGSQSYTPLFSLPNNKIGFLIQPSGYTGFIAVSNDGTDTSLGGVTFAAPTNNLTVSNSLNTNNTSPDFPNWNGTGWQPSLTTQNYTFGSSSVRIV